MGKKVYVFLADGFEEIEAITPIDVFKRANFDVATVSVSDKKEVSGAHLIIVKADKLFGDNNFNDADLLFLPGGIPGADNLYKHKGLAELLKQHESKGKHLAAICAAPYVLGELGLLKNHDATCYPGYEKQLHGANATGKSVVVSGKIITGKGAGVALPFALEIVSQLADKQTASELAKRMMVETN